LESPAIPEARQGKHAIHCPHGKPRIAGDGQHPPRRIVTEGSGRGIHHHVADVLGKLFGDPVAADNYLGRLSDNYDGRYDCPLGPDVKRGGAPTGDRPQRAAA
jgi:hypothetical protein